MPSLNANPHGHFKLARPACALLLSGAAVFGARSAPAQAPPQPEEADRGRLEEVVVTAQKRTETLQSVPVAISVFTGESLREQGLLDLKALSERTPGLFVGEQKPGQSQFFIRGIGSNDDGAAADLSVPLFIDEQYIPRQSGQIVDLFDLDRVEVLRGPQGTLFGRNASGGAIHLITEKPTQTPEARVEATFGNLNATNLAAYVSGPISGNLFGKVAFSSRKRDGYVRSVMADYPAIASLPNLENLRDTKFMKIDSENIRVGLRYLVSDDLEFNLSGTRATRDEDGTMRYFTPGLGTGGVFFNTDSRLIPDYANSLRRTVHDNPGFVKINNTLGSFRVDYRLPAGVAFTSLTTYQDGEINQDDVLATPLMARLRLSSGAVTTTFLGDNPSAEDSNAFSQEFRLASASDARLTWIAGLYYLKERVDRDETAGLGIVRSDGAGGLAPVVAVTRGGEYQEGRSSSYAAFGQGTYAITDSLNLTVGLRYTQDKKKVNVVGTAGGLVIASSYAGRDSRKWSKTTPKIALDFRPGEDLMFYALASNGFKSGGWQGLGPNAAAALTPYNPEFAWLYEVGAKTEWLDRRLRINLALFQTDYSDIQVSQSLVPENAPPNVVAVLFVSNAASSDIKGAELEFEAAPTDKLFFSGSYAFLDTEFTDFVIPPGFRPLASASLTAASRVGKELRRAPRHTATLLGRYTHPLKDGGSVAFQANFRYIAKSFGDVDNLFYGVVPSYDVADARITYAPAGDNWAISLWGSNLADEDYFLNNFPNLGSGWVTPAPPRTFGVTVNWEM